jgi:predicted  nucleic acid-binding Zn-ribbon protein
MVNTDYKSYIRRITENVDELTDIIDKLTDENAELEGEITDLNRACDLKEYRIKELEKELEEFKGANNVI